MPSPFALPADRQSNNKEHTQTAHTQRQMLYRTGDMGRWLADGNLEFGGRKDTQVGSFRIDLFVYIRQLHQMARHANYTIPSSSYGSLFLSCEVLLLLSLIYYSLSFQVKIRGYRIELSEVEQALTECVGVRAACVLARQMGQSRALVGYVVAGDKVDACSVRRGKQ